LFVHNPYTDVKKIFPLSSPIGTVVPVKDTNHKALIALQTGVHQLDLNTGEITFLCRPETKPNNRLNDGKCSPEGRFWVGSMSESFEPGAGSLFVVERDGKSFREALS